MKTMITYSPTALFAFVRLIEALAAVQRTCVGLWQHTVQSITPTWLKRHEVLKAELKEIGVTHRYDLCEIQAFKKHIVETRSDPMWRRSWWLVNLVARPTGIIAAVLFIGCALSIIVVFITLIGLIILETETMASHCLTAFLCAFLSAIGTCAFWEIQAMVYARIKTARQYRDYVTWQITTLDRLHDSRREVPEHALSIERTTKRLGGHTRVEDAQKRTIPVDPLLYVSAVPMWVSSIPGLVFLRLCVLQWGDDAFEFGGFSDRAKRPL